MRDLTVCFDCRHQGEHRKEGLERFYLIAGRGGQGGLMNVAALLILAMLGLTLWLLSHPH